MRWFIHTYCHRRHLNFYRNFAPRKQKPDCLHAASTFNSREHTGALVTRIPFPFKKSLINSEYHQWAKFSWSTGPAGRNNSKMSKGMNNVDSLLIMEPHVAFTPSGFLDRWVTPGKVETYRRLLLSFISHFINQSVIIEVVEKVKTLSGSSLCEDVMLSCVCALDWCRLSDH